MSDWFSQATPKTSKPLVLNPNESKDWFDNVAKGSTSTQGKGSPITREDIDTLIDTVRPIASDAAFTIGTGVSAPLGPFAPAVGAGAYAGVDALLQHLRSKPDQGFVSKTAGLEPGGIGDTLTNTLEQAGLNFAGGKIVGKGLSAIKELRNSSIPEIYKLGPTTSQALEAEGKTGIVQSVTRFLEDTFGTGAKKEAQTRSAQAADQMFLDKTYGMGHNFTRDELKDPNVMFKVLDNAYPGNYTVQGPLAATNFKELDKIIKDPDAVQSMLSKAQMAGSGNNLRKDMQAYTLGRLWQDAAGVDPINPDQVTLNVGKLSAALHDPEMQSSFGKIFSQKNRADIDQFVKNIAITQEKIASHPVAKQLWLWHGGVTLGLGLVSGHLSIPVADGIGMYLGTAALSKLLTNPNTARTMVALAGGQPLNMSEKMFSRLAMGVLQGSTVAIINRNGQQIPATVQGEQVVPIQQEK